MKYEDVYVRGDESVPALTAGLERFFPFSNEERPHQALHYRTPAAVYRQGRRVALKKGRQQRRAALAKIDGVFKA